jgi:hypothetical protein
MVRLEELTFSNSTLHALPVEADKGRSHTPHQVRGCVFSVCTPTPLRQPTLVAASQAALSLLGLDAEEVRGSWHQSNEYIMRTTIHNHKLCLMPLTSWPWRRRSGTSLCRLWLATECCQGWSLPHTVSPQL